MKSVAGQTTGGLIAPYSSPDEASQARRRVWWALGAFALGYALMLAFVLWGVFTEPSSSTGSGGSGGSVYPVGSFVGPFVVLALTMAYRRKLDLAAGRKLTRQEQTAIGDASAAGVVVAQADLVTAQEVAGREALSVQGGVVLALFMVPVALFPPVWFLMIGALAPVPFIPAALLVTLGLGYAFWVTLRRAAGVARVNAEFDAPLTEEERSLLGDEPE